MSFNWQSAPTQNLDDYLYDLLVPLEAYSATLRQFPTLVNGNVTIGIGFDLRAGGKLVQDAVLKFTAGRVGLDDVQHARIARDKARADLETLATRSVVAEWVVERALHPDAFIAAALQRLQAAEGTELAER